MKNLRRILAVMMTFVFAIALMIAPKTANAAAGNFTITINGDDTDGHTYVAYQIFTGDVTTEGDDKVLSNIEWAPGIDGAKIIEALGMDAASTATDVAKVVAGYSDKSDEAYAFADIVAANLGTATAISATTADNTKIEVTSEGYYIVMETGDLTGYKSKTRYILEVVSDVTVDTKAVKPSLDKSIVEGDDLVKSNTASIGEEVTFQLDSTVPDMAGYNKYFYIINDTMSKGLTFDPTSVEITVNGTPADFYMYVNDVKVTTENEKEIANAPTADTKIKIVLVDFYNNYKELAGKAIVVKYTGTVNENAVIGSKGNPNTVNLTYSNDPNTDYEGDPENPDEPGPDEDKVVGTTPDKKVVTYSTKIVLDKIDGKSKDALLGAKFKIEGEGLDIVVINEQVYEENASGDWYRLKDGTFTETAPTDLTKKDYDGETKYDLVTNVTPTTENTNVTAEAYVVMKDGKAVIEFKGLKKGTYEISEVEAPEGYNKITSTYKLVIDASIDNETETCTWSKATGSSDDFTANADGSFSITIENNKGIILPSTGGMGTTLFYVLGGVLVIVAGVLLITRRRMSDK